VQIKIAGRLLGGHGGWSSETRFSGFPRKMNSARSSNDRRLCTRELVRESPRGSRKNQGKPEDDPFDRRAAGFEERNLCVSAKDSLRRNGIRKTVRRCRQPSANATSTTSDHGQLSFTRPPPRCHRHRRRRRRRSRRAAIIRSSLIKLREMSKDSAMLGKTDNADADYYIPRRPTHSSARVGPPTKSRVRAHAVRVCVCVCRSVSTRLCFPAESTDAHTHMRALSRQLETGVNVLHLCKPAHPRRSAAIILFGTNARVQAVPPRETYKSLIRK